VIAMGRVTPVASAVLGPRIMHQDAVTGLEFG
jgi:hypothetical protein